MGKKNTGIELNHGARLSRTKKLERDLLKYEKRKDPELKDYINDNIKRLSKADVTGEAKSITQICLLAARSHTNFVAHLLKNQNTLPFIFSTSTHFAQSKEESPLEAAFKKNQGKEFLSADLTYTSKQVSQLLHFANKHRCYELGTVASWK